MLETRAFEGTPEELSQFVCSTWKASYAGKMAVPNWTADYFRWQVRLHEPDAGRRVTAVYSGSQLAGVLIFCPYDFELHGKQYRAAQSSWLSVSPEFRRMGVGKALQKGTIQACRDDGADFRIGYVYQGSSRSQGPLFWLQKGKPVQGKQALGPRLGFWVRVLDPGGAIRWNLSGLDRFLVRMVRPLIPVAKPPKPIAGVDFREFRESDLDRCVELANAASEGKPLRILWNRDTLGSHLQGFGKSVVATQDGILQGFIAFHVIDILARESAPIGIIDLICAKGLSSAASRGLLDSASAAMKQNGAVVALKLKTGDYPPRFFMRLGWAPRLADSQMVFTWCGEPRNASTTSQCHVLWR